MNKNTWRQMKKKEKDYQGNELNVLLLMQCLTNVTYH